MKFVIVIECADADAKGVAHVLREASKTLPGLGDALLKMPADGDTRSAGAQRARTEASSWWWAYEGS
jgi:hypothetical protein